MHDYYDVLITSASWEARSASILKYVSDVRFRQAYVFRYVHHQRPRAAGMAEQQYHDLLVSQLSRNCTEPVISVPGQLWEPLDGLRSVISNLRRTFGNESGLRILFDASTFTKAYVLVFLRYLDNDALRNRVTLFYTDLAQPQVGTPSEGVKDVITLPFYGGDYRTDRDTLLITFMASEPERVTALWEHISPQMTVPLFSYRRDHQSPLKSRILKEQFLCQPGVQIPIEVDGSNPLNVAAALAAVYAQSRDQHNIVLGAVGNKLEALGMYIFSKVQGVAPEIFYPIAGRYHLDYWNPTVIGSSMLMELSSGCSVTSLKQQHELVSS